MGQDEHFLAAFEQAKAIIASMPGFIRLSLSGCPERDSVYLLLVEWQSAQGHIHGFRESGQYDQWRRLLHYFYEPFPTVEHYEEVLRC